MMLLCDEPIVNAEQKKKSRRLSGGDCVFIYIAFATWLHIDDWDRCKYHTTNVSMVLMMRNMRTMCSVRPAMRWLLRAATGEKCSLAGSCFHSWCVLVSHRIQFKRNDYDGCDSSRFHCVYRFLKKNSVRLALRARAPPRFVWQPTEKRPMQIYQNDCIATIQLRQATSTFDMRWPGNTAKCRTRTENKTAKNEMRESWMVDAAKWKCHLKCVSRSSGERLGIYSCVLFLWWSSLLVHLVCVL